MPQDLLTKPQRNFLTSAKEVAIQMGRNGRALTGVIGELSACEKLGLKWEPTDGYDAVDGSGKKYQIKTRKNWWKYNKADPAGRMGRFKGRRNYDFDAGIYVELDDDWEVWGIWECEKSVLKELEKGNSRGLHVRKVVEHGLLRYARPR